MTDLSYNPANSEKMRRVAEIIEGTCKSLDDVVQEVFDDETIQFTDLDTELLRELDDITQECAECGWWCETSDLNDEHVCSDCCKDQD